MRDQAVVTYREAQVCTCTGRLLVGARHSPGTLTNSDVVRPCGQIVGNSIWEGGAGTGNPRLVTVPMGTNGGGVSGSVGLVCRSH